MNLDFEYSTKISRDRVLDLIVGANLPLTFTEKPEWVQIETLAHQEHYGYDRLVTDLKSLVEKGTEKLGNFIQNKVFAISEDETTFDGRECSVHGIHTLLDDLNIESFLLVLWEPEDKSAHTLKNKWDETILKFKLNMRLCSAFSGDHMVHYVAHALKKAHAICFYHFIDLITEDGCDHIDVIPMIKKSLILRKELMQK